MKMKSISHLAFFLLFSLTKISCEEKNIAPEQTIFQQETVSQTPTPSEVGATELKKFFTVNYDFLRSRKRTYKQLDQHSRTSLFNQSLNRYITEIYNEENYADQLSRNGAHFIEFFRIGNELNLDVESLYTCQRLLFNKIKECEIIDDTVVNQILTPLAELVEPYFVHSKKESHDSDFLIKEVDALILHKFTNHLPAFQATPDTFITELAQEIIKVMHHKHSSLKAPQSEPTVERFRNLLKQTIETLLSKMMWNPLSYQSLKPSFVALGNSILQLAEKKVIDHMDDIDDLLTSLNTRFCYFLKVYGSVIPAHAIDDLLESLKNKELFFLELEEQDAEITPKKEILTRHLVRAKAKSIAHAMGHQTDQLV